MKVFHFLEKSVCDHPQNIAVIHLDRKITYLELHNFSGCLASFLKGLSLNPGSRIALLWDNSIEYVSLFFATFKANLVLVPLDTSLGQKRIAPLLPIVEPRFYSSNQNISGTWRKSSVILHHFLILFQIDRY